MKLPFNCLIKKPVMPLWVPACTADWSRPDSEKNYRQWAMSHLSKIPGFWMPLCMTILILVAPLNKTMAQDIRTSRKTSYYTYIYQLKENEAKKIYKTNLSKIRDTFFHTLIDSFPTDSIYKKQLNYGHYLYLHAEGNQIKYKLASISNVDIKIMNNSSDLVLYITNKACKPIQNAIVEVGSKKLQYDDKTGAFRLEHANTKGFLAVQYEGITNFFYITRKKNNPAINRTSRKIFYQTPLKYVAVPVVMTAYLPLDIYRLAAHQRRSGWIYYISQPFYDIVRSVSWGEPQGFIEKIVNKFNSRSKTDGYVAFNKTVYRPGDTVMWKAYIIDAKKKPVDQEMFLMINNFHFNRTVNLGKVSAKKPGIYYGHFVLADTMSLTLDNNYMLWLSSKRHVLSGSFHFEDYELKSTTYELRALKTDHYNGDQNKLILKGTDENNLSLADARASILILPDKAGDIFDTRIFIPDTLWSHELTLNPSGETEVLVPQDIFPKANFSYKVIADFLNSSNEHLAKEIKLRYYYHDDKLQISFNNDSVRFERSVNGNPVPGRGAVRFYKSNDVISQIDTVLPFTCKLNPFVTRYEIVSGKKSHVAEMLNELSLVECFTERDKDSIRFLINNPRNLPISYFVYNLNREVFRGSGNLLGFALPNNSEKNYYLSVHYLWNNRVVSENYEIPLKTSVLNITSDQPEYIYPGQKVAIKLKVTDYKANPVEGADMLAWSMTAKMPRAELPVLPELETRKKQKELINEFFLKQEKLNQNSSIPLDWKKWNPIMHLDSITYFQFLFPANGMFSCSFPMNDSIMGYISPYVVKNGNISPVYCIYANNKLIYSHYTNVDIPYVFAIPKGITTLRLRIPNAEIVAENLSIEAGKKYIMSFNNDTSNHYAKITKKSFRLEEYERIWIKNSLMMIDKNSKHNFGYIVQDRKVFPVNDNKYDYNPYKVVGPLSQSDFRYEVPGEFSIEERFEPGFRYLFKKGVVKMYSINQKDIYSYSNYKLPETRFGDSVLTERRWLKMWKHKLAETQANSRVYNNPDKTTAGHGRMKLYYTLPRGRFTKNVILFKYSKPDFIRVYGNSELFHQLEPGLYRAVILDNNNAYLEADSLSITANGLNTFAISVPWKEPDVVSEKINQIIQKESTKSSITYPDEKKSWQTVKETYLQNNNITLTGQNVIEGVLKDATTDEPLIGVNVIAEGTTIGTTTDINGYYQLDVPPGTGTLVFSYIGYVTERVPIGLSRIINTYLTPDIQKLEEVVVVGYGTMKKSDFTAASVSTVQVRGIKMFQGQLAGVNASAIYGSNAPVFVESKGTLSDKARQDTEFMSGLNNAASLRSHFSDYAFWQPALTTDKNGEATFEVTFPDDITAWKTFYIAMGNKKAGSLQATINAFKPIAANLALPRFMIEGDSSVAIGKTTNYGKDPVEVKSQFKVEEEVRAEKEFSLVNSHIDSLSLKAGNSDSITITYQVTPAKGFSDGEKRSIPVYKRGSMETEGFFSTLEKDSVLNFVVPANYTEAELYLDADPINIIRQEIKHVHNYGYLCNEQAASKLKSLLAEKTICKYLNSRFTYNRDIKKLISRLESFRNFENLWGWWKDSEVSLWISLHVLEALLQAEKEGYEINIPRETIQQYLLSRYPAYSAGDKIRTLKTLLQLNAGNKIKFDLDDLLKSENLDFVARLEIMELLQKTGTKIGLDTLLKQKRETMFGNYYWGSDSFDISRSYIMATLGVYRIIQNDSNHLDYLPKIRNFFLEQRKTGYWRNTYESAQIIETILPDMLRDKKQLTNPSAFLHMNSTSLKVDSFPFHHALRGGDSVKISIKGDFPVFTTVYQKRWNNHPQAVSKGFRVNTYFEDHTNTLKAGIPVKLFAEIHVLKRASYVMIEVPIPSGCSYEEKYQRNKWEVHREYFKNKVCIFYNDLPIGNYIAEIELLPRFNGKYTINPAKAEMMYFPVFYGRNEMKDVIVK